MKVLAAVAAIWCFAALSFGQTPDDDDSEILVPISLTNPIEIRVEFLAEFWADLYGRNYLKDNSAIWLGEHLDEDPSRPRRAILAERSGGSITFPVDPDAIVFEEVSRYPIEWIESSNSMFWATLEDPDTGVPLTPSEFEVYEYYDATVLKFHLLDGTTRLVVGMGRAIDMNILNPPAEQARFVVENFWPIERFYSESQADGYARDLAVPQEPWHPDHLLVMNDPCAAYSGLEAQLCYCQQNILSDFAADHQNCNFDPNAFQNGIIGGGAGAAVGGFGGGVLQKLAKKISGWGTVAATAVGGVVGAHVGYMWTVEACQTRALNDYSNRLRKAHNNYNNSVNNGEPFVCPGSGGIHIQD